MTRRSSTVALLPTIPAGACGGSMPLDPDSLSAEVAGESFPRPVVIEGTLVSRLQPPQPPQPSQPSQPP